MALVARRGPELELLAAAIRERGGDAMAVVADATDPEAIAAAVRSVVTRWGRLEVAVANVGVYRRGLAIECSRADLEDSLRDNFWSAFHLSESVLPHLRASRGQLVFVNSFDAKKCMPCDAAYSAAKAALASFGASLRQAVGPAGVNVCSVFPGRVDTEMLAGLEVPRISRKIPAARVARAVCRAIRRRRSEVVVPWSILPLWWIDVLSPRLADWLVRALALDGRLRA